MTTALPHPATPPRSAPPAPARRAIPLRLLALTRGVRPLIALALLLGVATVALNSTLLAVAAYVIAAAALHPPLIALSIPLALIRISGVGRAFARYAERLASHNATFRLLARLRGAVYAGLAPLAPAGLRAFRSGDLLARLVEDVEELENLYGRIATPLAIGAIVAALTGLALWSFSPLLAGVAVAALLVAGLGVPLLAGWLGHRAGQREIARRAELQALLVDSIQGMADLLACGREGDYAARVAALDRDLARARRRAAWIDGLQGALGEALTYGTLAAILALAIPLARADRFGGVYLAAIALVVLGAFEAIAPLGRAFGALGRTLATGRRLFEILDTPPPVTDPASPAPPPPPGVAPALAFERVTFRYAPDEPPALRDITFSLDPGAHVAIVGPSGAGKSTVVSLALRFADPEEGAIRFAGRDLRDYAQEELRRALGVASQDSHLFSDTLRNNLLLARPGATDADLVATLARVELAELLAQLPHGLDTWIGEHGLRLSGGERQRLILARALLRDAPLLIVDEPTANLDTATEGAILATLHEAAAGRALLLITHRLVRMERFDTILVLHEGAIAERGTHRELLARAGHYRRLYEAQEAGVAAP